MARPTSRWVAALAMAVAALTAVAGSAGAIEFGCRIGKPSYCYKYGQMFCLKENDLPGREQACADWTAACLACHALIPQCLGGARPPHNSPLCRTCGDEWHGCMRAIDAAYWPNRLKPKAEE